MQFRINRFCFFLLLGLLVTLKGESQEAHPDFTAITVGQLDSPWALEFLPDSRILISEMKGTLKLLDYEGAELGEVSGVPEVVFGGQGGLADIVLHPDFEVNQLLYLSYAEAGANKTAGAAVARGRLVLGERGGELQDLEVIWRQVPKVKGRGHYGHCLLYTSPSPRDGLLSRMPSSA